MSEFLHCEETDQEVVRAVLDRLDGAGFERTEIALDAEADPPWSRETWERLQDKYGVDAPVPDYTQGLDAPLDGLRIGVPAEFFEPDVGAHQEDTGVPEMPVGLEQLHGRLLVRLLDE